MKHTLVIVGAGLAGLSAALTAVKNGWTVKLVSSLASERAQSVMAEGGINAALNTKGEEDSPEQHYTDTLTAACGLADPNAVWGMTQAASELVRSLHHLGVQFNVTDDDELDLRNFGGQKKKRTAFAQSDTGKQLMTALIDAVRREESAGTVERFPHHKFRTLLLSGNICGGCTVQDTYTGELLRFVCDAVLIATGGLHGLFGDTTGSLANTGEVTAELFRLGVPMANLEMIQYHPTTVELGEKRMLLSEAARGEGGRLFALRNGKPWYFMEEKYPELGNLMPRDITAREVWTVSRDYEVFLDMTELPKEVMEHKLAGLVDDCQTYLHKDIRKEPIPILPGIHYFMGGIQVDERHRTSMRNLYAAGECCAQYHGANRLGGNSLLGAIYGGQIAAETACRETVSSPNMPCAEESLLPELSPDAQMQMNRILLNALGVVRDAQTLEAGIQEIRKLSGTLPLLGCAMLESALARKESRGAHWRADYPQRKDAVYCKTTVAHWNGQHIAISFESIPERRLYGDNVFEKHGINRDRTGDREKTRYLCGKQGIFTRDRALIRPGFIRQLETRASTRSASFFHALGSLGRPRNGGGAAGAYRTRNGAKPLNQGHLRAKRWPLGPSRKSQQQTKRTGFAAHGHSIAETAPEGKRASRANGALIRA